MEGNNYPTFFTTEEFAEIQGQSLDHIRHAAKNYAEPGGSVHSRSKLPAGFGAFRWGRQWVVYVEAEAEQIEELFRVTLPGK